jgi:hypothetical protein
MHRLGLDDPSDYDLNISNARMVEIARARWDPTRFAGDFLEGHGYLNKELMASTFPTLSVWARSWSLTLGVLSLTGLHHGRAMPSRAQARQVRRASIANRSRALGRAA